MKGKVAAALLTGVAMLIALPAWASSITFDLSSCSEAGLSASFCPNVDAGTNTITYTSGGMTLLATGNQMTSGANADLYVKQDGTGEIGLGMAVGPHGEIQSTDFVTLDFSKLFKAGFTTATLSLGSIQPGEAGNICQGSSDTAIGSTNCAELNNPSGGVVQSATFTFTGSSDDVLSITADAGDVLILSSVNVGASTVPEPGSLLLLGSGLLGLGGFIRYRLKA